MKIFEGSDEAHGKIKRPVLALGNFDGIHLAHQKMFQLACTLAKKLRGTPGVYTFEPHPVKILSPESAPPLINTLDQKIELIQKQKIKNLILEPFSPRFSALSPEAFFKEILCQKLGVVGIVAGYDFTFGAKRSGTLETLEKLCREHQVAYQILEAFFQEGTLVSSSQIREFIREGKIEKACKMLGHFFELRGEVVRGEGIGAALGFPTANILVENELIPASGVYATQIQIGSKTDASVTNIGYRPTFGGKRLTVETHILKFHKRIYHQKIKLRFIRRIRDEISFASKEELVKQIHQDIKTCTPHPPLSPRGRG